MVLEYNRNSGNQASLADPRLSGLSVLSHGTHKSWDMEVTDEEDDMTNDTPKAFHSNAASTVGIGIGNGFNGNAANTALPEAPYDEEYNDEEYEYDYEEKVDEIAITNNVNVLPQFVGDKNKNRQLNRHMALSSTSNVSIPPPVPSQDQKSLTSDYNEESFAQNGFQTQANILYDD